MIENIDNVNFSLEIKEINKTTICLEIIRLDNSKNKINLFSLFNIFQKKVDRFLNRNSNITQIMTAYATNTEFYDARKWMNICYDIFERKKPAGWQVIRTNNMLILRKV